MKQKCIKCGSLDIRQSISVMIDPNDPAEFDTLIKANDWTWDDFTYCVECEDECHTTEVED